MPLKPGKSVTEVLQELQSKDKDLYGELLNVNGRDFKDSFLLDRSIPHMVKFDGCCQLDVLIRELTKAFMLIMRSSHQTRTSKHLKMAVAHVASHECLQMTDKRINPANTNGTTAG